MSHGPVRDSRPRQAVRGSGNDALAGRATPLTATPPDACSVAGAFRDPDSYDARRSGVGAVGATLNASLTLSRAIRASGCPYVVRTNLPPSRCPRCRAMT